MKYLLVIALSSIHLVCFAGNGQYDYEVNCANCHSTGAFRAPNPANSTEWIERLKKGKEELYKSAWYGFGRMPPRGADLTLTEAEAMRALNYMISIAPPNFPEEIKLKTKGKVTVKAIEKLPLSALGQQP